MGATIQYRGKIDDPARVGDLQRELADIAGSIGWKWHTLDDDWSIPPSAKLAHVEGCATIIGHLGLRGIDLIPAEEAAEPVSFMFDATGQLSSVMDVILNCEGPISPEVPWVFVKTQFVSPDTHIWIIGLLKYLKKHYLSNLEVDDEGGYWATGDRAALVTKMRFLDEKMASLANELASVRFANMAGLSAEEIAKRIENFLRKNHAPPPDQR